MDTTGNTPNAPDEFVATHRVCVAVPGLLRVGDQGRLLTYWPHQYRATLSAELRNFDAVFVLSADDPGCGVSFAEVEPLRSHG